MVGYTLIMNLRERLIEGAQLVTDTPSWWPLGAKYNPRPIRCVNGDNDASVYAPNNDALCTKCAEFAGLLERDSGYLPEWAHGG